MPYVVAVDLVVIVCFFQIPKGSFLRSPGPNCSKPNR